MTRVDGEGADRRQASVRYAWLRRLGLVYQLSAAITVLYCSYLVAAEVGWAGPNSEIKGFKPDLGNVLKILCYGVLAFITFVGSAQAIELLFEVADRLRPPAPVRRAPEVLHPGDEHG